MGIREAIVLHNSNTNFKDSFAAFAVISEYLEDMQKLQVYPLDSHPASLVIQITLMTRVRKNGRYQYSPRRGGCVR